MMSFAEGGETHFKCLVGSIWGQRDVQAKAGAGEASSAAKGLSL